MIKIDRNRVAMPDVLSDDENSLKTKETSAAIEFFRARREAREANAIDEKFKKGFNFRAYAHATVKHTLQELFYRKCAYCEIDYGGAACDVEHFRPKGGIDYPGGNGEKKSYPDGYFWLAADWTNLLYSCQHCNREENHYHGGPEETRLRVSGKGNYFPLTDEQYRLALNDEISKENPYRLLLDPCIDDPSIHLDFLQNGMVVPKEVDGQTSPKGAESIKYYGLQRVELVEKRAHTAKTFMLLLRSLKRLKANLDRDPNDGDSRKELGDTLKHVKEDFLANGRPFLALTKKIFSEEIIFQNNN